MIARNPYDPAPAGQLVIAAATPAWPPAKPADRTMRLGWMPSHDQITYWRDAVVLVLLVAAFPWVMHKLLTNPARVLEGGGVPKPGV